MFNENRTFKVYQVYQYQNCHQIISYHLFLFNAWLNRFLVIT